MARSRAERSASRGSLAAARLASFSFALAALLATTSPARSQEPGPRPPHPHPRVIVSATKVRGPHDRAAVERAARLGWGRIVSCYEEAKARGTAPRGVVVARLEIAARGEVTRARRLRASLAKSLAKCLVGAMRGLAMPRARSGSSADVSIQVAPGDPPRPPDAPEAR